MTEISIGRLQPSSMVSTSGSIKSYLNNGLQVASEAINPAIVIDVIQLDNVELAYTFDSDLIIQAIGLSSSGVSVTLSVSRQDTEVIFSTAITSSLVNSFIPIAIGETLTMIAASQINVRLVMVKTHFEVKL